ncbi:ATP-dependent helicase [Methanolobus bombayensis]|uniref:ATP-dependent helicase n=1 Tax=Methanolobus bombayensis TaxID=38023 RepID=UPI001AE3876C|nr:ATP-dependent helicase [Methanolobus bombayensis]MBP1908569.1 DNA helicase-2/ATP-dependent DNA helicase PcrA [Methanolobus bombayensis]
MISIFQLNESQRQAVEWGDKSLLVLAGPGSGKTAVLTMRIANIIQNSSDENFRILGLTFTVKAAKEMKDRISVLLGHMDNRVQLRTFHAFCTDLLRQHGSHFNLKPDFSVITDIKDRITILKEFDVDNPEDILNRIDTMFTHGISVEELPEYFGPENQNECYELQSIFNQYIQALLKENQLDFGSMLYFTRQLLETKPRIARQLRIVYKYICVDEFQDTNLAQYKILKLLAPPKNANIFVVADEDQIIFQWNGADPKRLESLKSDYNIEVLQLPYNYRCPKEIVEIANKLIEHNSYRIHTKTPGIPFSNESGTVKLTSYENFEHELLGLANEINSIPLQSRDKCLLIARSNKLLTAANKYLNEHRINAEIVSKNQDFSSPILLTMYFCLKLANAPNSRSVLNKLCASATDINGLVLSAEDISAKAHVEGSSLLRAFFDTASQSEILNPVCNAGITYLCDTIQFQKFIDIYINHFDHLNSDDENDDLFPDYKDDKENWTRIAQYIEDTYEGNAGLHVFLQEMDLTPKLKSIGKDCVRLQTVHSAKGTEFEHVFIIGLAEEQFPTYFAVKSGDKSVEEERRNCFVAITRASKSLYLSYANEYFGWHKQPSRFLKEMGLLND